MKAMSNTRYIAFDIDIRAFKEVRQPDKRTHYIDDNYVFINKNGDKLIMLQSKIPKALKVLYMTRKD